MALYGDHHVPDEQDPVLLVGAVMSVKIGTIGNALLRMNAIHEDCRAQAPVQIAPGKSSGDDVALVGLARNPDDDGTGGHVLHEQCVRTDLGVGAQMDG